MNFKIFTVDEANRSLPELTRLIKQLRSRREDMKCLLTELEGCLGQRSPHATDAALERRIEMKQLEIKAIQRELKELVGLVEETGVVLRDLEQGLVDFPAVVHRQSGYLCWRLGEDEVAFWHGPEDGFAGRRPLTAGRGREGAPGL